MSARSFVERAWSGEAGWLGGFALTLLSPLEAAFRAGVRRRNRGFDTGKRPSLSAPVPVISVGNLSVGGTGKTPVARWVVGELLRADRAPGLLSRGYGADELALHRRWNPAAPVHADPDRVEGAGKLVADGCASIVLDDGFQHRRLARVLDLVLVSAEQGLPGHLLPRGPFREPAESLGRAQAVVVTRKSAGEAAAVAVRRQAEAFVAPGSVVARACLRPSGLVPLGDWAVGEGSQAESGSRPGSASEGGASSAGGAGSGPVGARSGVPGMAVVVTSVAQPASVAAAAEALGVQVAGERSFRDHHEFTRREVQDIRFWASGRPVIVTEKDAVKLAAIPEAADVAFMVLTQELVWEEGEEALLRLVLAATGGGDA